MNTHIQTFVDRAWELIPEYSKEPKSLRKAIESKQGSCANHSALIGRMALQEGIPAVRSVLFSATEPSHFGTLLFISGSWQRVSTDGKPNAVYCNPEDRVIVPNSISWSRSYYGLLEPLNDDATSECVSELAIPEIQMAYFAGACTLADYLTIGRMVSFLDETQ